MGATLFSAKVMRAPFISMPLIYLSCISYVSSLHSVLSICCLLMHAVVEGMDVVYAVEAVGSGSGKTSKLVTIADSGELS